MREEISLILDPGPTKAEAGLRHWVMWRCEHELFVDVPAFSGGGVPGLHLRLAAQCSRRRPLAADVSARHPRL